MYSSRRISFQWNCKLLKPRNVVEMLHNGSRDCGFAGLDIIEELDACVEPLFDTGLDPVRIVVGVPNRSEFLDDAGQLRRDRHVRIATEYERLTRKWIIANDIKATTVRSHGSTEGTAQCTRRHTFRAFSCAIGCAFCCLCALTQLIARLLSLSVCSVYS